MAALKRVVGMTGYRDPEAMYITALIRSIDDILLELEDIREQQLDYIPIVMRHRIARVLALVPDPDRKLVIRRRVGPMVDTLFDAQETLLGLRGVVRPVVAPACDNGHAYNKGG
jgi:hypothetical protein